MLVVHMHLYELVSQIYNLKLPPFFRRSSRRPAPNRLHCSVVKTLTSDHNVNDTNDTKELSSTTRKFAIAMSVAETESGEEDDLVRVPYSGPSGSTFRDYK